MEVIRRGLEELLPSSLLECRQFGAQFRSALINANAEIGEDDLAIYDRAFEEELPALAAGIREAQAQAADGALTDHQVSVWREILSTESASVFFASLRALGPRLRHASRQVFASQGVAAHMAASQALFARIQDDTRS